MANLVTFKGETYDITDFIPNHPGGSIINRAKGNNLEDVWKENGVEWHLNNSRVMDTLENYKVIAENLNYQNSNNEKDSFNKNGKILFDLLVLFALLIIFLYFV